MDKDHAEEEFCLDTFSDYSSYSENNDTDDTEAEVNVDI